MKLWMLATCTNHLNVWKGSFIIDLYMAVKEAKYIVEVANGKARSL